MTDEKLKEALKVEISGKGGERMREFLFEAIEGVLDGAVSADSANAISALAAEYNKSIELERRAVRKVDEASSLN